MPKFKFIDSHVHLFPESFFRGIWKWFDECAWPVKYQISVDEIIKTLTDLGGEKLVTYNYSHKAGVSSYLNEWNYNLTQKYTNLIFFAAIHPEDDDLTSILHKAFVEYKLYGVKVQCHVNKIPPEDESMFPIYEMIIEHNKVLNIHAVTGPPVPNCNFNPKDFSGINRIKRVMKRYPNLQCIIPHLGSEEFEEFFDLMREYENLWTDTTMTLSGFISHDIDTERLVEFQDRILYGSDFPNIPYDKQKEMNYIKSLGLGKEIEEKIFYTNAKRLFNLESETKGSYDD